MNALIDMKTLYKLYQAMQILASKGTVDLGVFLDCLVIENSGLMHLPPFIQPQTDSHFPVEEMLNI